jgi:hypothetical protein
MTKSFTRRVSRMDNTQLRELLYRAHAKDLWRVVDIITTETDERHPDPRDREWSLRESQDAPHDHADELNGKTYRTDAETLSMIRSIVPAAKASGDASAIQAVMSLGLSTGRIQEV